MTAFLFGVHQRVIGESVVELRTEGLKLSTAGIRKCCWLQHVRSALAGRGIPSLAVHFLVKKEKQADFSWFDLLR